MIFKMSLVCFTLNVNLCFSFSRFVVLGLYFVAFHCVEFNLLDRVTEYYALDII